ncbi:MAG: formate dehydrogenase [Selenomonadaceae bacterium]|nr:formate dehydrogenase [Selenomonadaceae bacterium]
MNLKEAFQAQNKIEKLFDFVSGYLDDGKNLVSITEKHLRSKAAEGQPDEKINIVIDNKFPPDKVIDFLLMLIDEREKLAKAIHAAKSSMQFDLDSAVDVNKKRHLAVDTLRELRQFKSSSLLEKNAGVGYVFNKEGNQTTYRYDIERVKTIDYDRNRVRDLIDKLQVQADKVSNEIDFALISTTVKYKLPFDMNAGNLEVIEDYVTNS